MARTKDAKAQTKQKKTAFTLELPTDIDLSFRLQKISEQTGLSIQNLLQKWLLQEEQQIGFILHCEENFLNTLETYFNTHLKSSLQPLLSKTAPMEPVKSKKAKLSRSETTPSNLDYRKSIVEKIKKLKAEGMGNTKIAQLFNAAKQRTMSGSGKWYSSSIAWLLKIK